MRIGKRNGVNPLSGCFELGSEIAGFIHTKTYLPAYHPVNKRDSAPWSF